MAILRYSTSLFVDDFTTTSKSSLNTTTSICCCSRKSDPPKLQPFSRTKIDRVLKDPPLIQKSENQLAEYCSTLEGENSYSCWQAYFELKDLEISTKTVTLVHFLNSTKNEACKDEVEKVILQAGGMKSLIGCLHGISAIHKAKKESANESNKAFSNAKKLVENPCPIPDGLPRSVKEMEEDEKALMPDSPFTRLLRNKGRFPAWYSPAPDHETD